MSRRPTVIRLQKASLVCAGLVGALVMVEVGLRGAGAAYAWWRMRALGDADAAAGPRAVRVLCVGDSFTFGIGAPAGESYPEHLQRLLSHAYPERAISVNNRGVPGDNSSQVLDRLARILPTARPEVVVVLAGTNNTWNTAQASVPPPGHSYLSRWLHRLAHWRIGRVVTLVVASARPGRQAHMSRLFSMEPYLFLNLGPDARVARLDALADGSPRDEATCLELGRLYLGEQRLEDAAAVFQQALEFNSRNDEAHVGLALSRMFAGEFSNEVEALLTEAIRMNPDSSSAHRVRGVVRLLRGETSQGWEDFRVAVALDPALEQAVPRLDGTAREPEGFGRYVQDWYVYDVTAMARLVRASGSDLVLLTYPMRDGVHPLSAVVRRAGQQLDIPVVDLEADFLTLPPGMRDALFAADGSHLNARGYGLVAAHVADRLIERRRVWH